MFYSHEVLTSRKHGVATVWLVATLGSKSNLKKVSRKAILDVDVQKACETIVTPEAPMALRLQSNLLYGITRVYSQQCGYVLTDAETARNSMRTVLKMMRTSALDEQGHKGRADQLVLQDDPNFLPDIDIALMDLDRIDFDARTADGSQRSTFSPHSSQHAGFGVGSQQDIGGLLIPQSASSFIGAPVGSFGGFSVHGSVRHGAEEGTLLDDDLGLVVGDDGALLDDVRVRHPMALPSRGERTELSAANAGARRKNGQGEQVQDVVGLPDDDGFVPLQEEYIYGSDAQALPPPSGDAVQQPQQETSEETADAPMRRRARPASRVILLDTNMELRNGDLSRWHTEYLNNMAQALRHKNAGKAVAQAKKNAEFWMLGQGEGGPLSLFRGARFIEALTGVRLGAGGQKRPRDEGYETDETRRKRSRGEEPYSDEIARGIEYDDGFPPMAGDDTIERGREAPTPPDDPHLSSLMPWNQSGGSRRPTALFTGTGQQHSASASTGRGGLQLSLPIRRGSRLTSASPLQGRGAPALPGDTDDFQLPGSPGDIDVTDADDFELYGAVGNVDTQTAAQSQWQRVALDGESVNFLDFVKAGAEGARVQAGARAGGDGLQTPQGGSVEFETLLPPDGNTCVVAAQALLHVLALGTKNWLAVRQGEAFGAITLRPVVAV